MTRRLHILSEAEIKALYGLPCFNQEDRHMYFTLEPQEETALNTWGNATTKFNFVLQLGYFKAKQQFFNPDNTNKEDIAYLQQRYFPKLTTISNLSISKPTRLQLQTQILKLMDYYNCSAEIKAQLKQLAATSAVIDSKPRFLLKELVNFLQKNRIMLPGYTSLQDIVSEAIANEEKRLTLLITQHLPEGARNALDSLLQAEHSLHELTYLKKEPQDFSLKQMTQEIKRLQQIQFLYEIAKLLLPLLTISAESIHYYASLVDYYTLYKLKRIKSAKVYIYLLCLSSLSKNDGINRVNFAILYLFDYLFAPRFKDTAGKIDTIYGFHHPRYYQDLLIKPVRKINIELIISEWENILRIMLSLATKATTQSIIIGKLSSYERKNRTKAALWEFDNIIRSIHILRYIDDITYRQNIQKALNRGESYHRLRRAVSYANGGKLRVRTELAQQIYNECGRLLANNIILYNAPGSSLSY